MFVNNINPQILNLGFLDIRWYGVIYALGFLLMFFTFPLMLKLRPVKNFYKKDVSDYITYVIVGVVLGARLFIILIYDPPYYFSNPSHMFAFWEGGMSFHGGLLGAIIATYLFAKKRNIKFWEIADMASVHASLSLFLGRIANFINSELYGTITDVPWCVKFKNAEGCRHPSQLYESAKNLLSFAILLFLHKRPHKSGFIFSMFILLYGTLRFLIEFVRFSPVHPLGLSIGQWLCIPMIIAGGIMVFKLRK